MEAQSWVMKGTRMSLTPLMPAIKSKRLGFELVNENYIGTTSGSAVRVGHIHQRLARWMRSIPRILPPTRDMRNNQQMVSDMISAPSKDKKLL